MGLADFFAQAGAGTGIGNIAQAFGGRTAGQAAMEDFVNNQLPQLYDQAKSATTPDTMHQFLLNFTAKSAQAGLNPDAALKLGKELMVPLMQNMQADAIDKVKNDYAPRTTATVPVDYGQPGQVRGPDVTTPGKPYDLQGAFGLVSGLARAGAPMPPAGIQQTLETPGNIAAKQISNQQTQQAIDEQQRRGTIKLPGSAGEAGLTAADLTGTGTGPLGTYMAGLNPQRADPLDEARKGLITAQTAHAQAATGAAGREGRGSQMMQDFIRSGGNPNDRQGFIEFASGITGAKQPAPKPLSIQDLIKAKQAAQNQVTAILKNQSVFQRTGATGDPNLANAQAMLEGLNQQIADLQAKQPTPGSTPATAGRGGPPRPAAAVGPSPEEVKAAKKRLGLIK